MIIKFSAELQIEPETPSQMFGRVVDGVLDRVALVASEVLREKVYADTMAHNIARQLDLWLRRVSESREAKAESRTPGPTDPAPADSAPADPAPTPAVDQATG